MKLSILIPIHDSLSDYETTLASVLKWRPPRSRILVFHDAGFQDPYDLSGEVEFCQLRFSDWSRWFSKAVTLVDTELICTIQPGFEVSQGWYDQVEQQFKKSSVVSVAPAFACDNADVRGLYKAWNGQSKLCIAGAHREVDSASRFAGVWRTGFVRPVVEKLEHVRSNSLDLELGLFAKRSGHEIAVVTDPLVTTCMTTAQLQLSMLSTGYRAQQIMLRHHKPGMVPTIIRSLAAITAEPFGGPQRLIDCVGRMLAMAGLKKQSAIANEIINDIANSCADSNDDTPHDNTKLEYSRAA